MIHPEIEKILISQEEIATKIKEIASQINQTFNQEEIIVVCIMKGSLVFTADLIREITCPVVLDYMQVSSYGSGTSSSKFINVKRDLEESVEGKNVLIIEDIIDSGNTLYKLKELFDSKNAKKVQICTLLDKPSRRESNVQVDYCGFQIPDEFVVGYGLDYNQRYRSLPYVGILKRSVYEK